jgi:hypothetical protein
MSLSFQEVAQIRRGVTEYASQFEDEKLRELPLDGLLSHLAESTGETVTKKDLGNIFYRGVHKELDLDESLYKDRPVLFLSRYISGENESLQRIEALLDMSVSDMNDEELQQAAVDMFMMSNAEYEAQVDERGLQKSDINRGHFYDWSNDSSMLLGVLEKRGTPLSKEYLRDKVLETDFNLGHMDGMFRGRFSFGSRDDHILNRGVIDVHRVLHSNLTEQRQKLEQHLVADESLKARHTIQSPRLLADQTLSLDVIPYAVAFTQNGNLAVLGGQVNSSKNDWESSQMLLNVYNIKNGQLVNSTNTEIHSRFDGIVGMASNFQGSLTSGTDDILYVNGGRRFSADLEELADNEGKFQGAWKVLNDREILNYSNEPFAIVEADGVFYFAIQPRHSPKCYDNILVATDGEKIIGEPIVGYSPNGGSGGSEWDDTPTIAVHGNDIFFKASKLILAVDRSMTKDAAKKPFVMAGSGSGIASTIPSNHCLSPNGVLYAVNEFEEEVAQSIHGYVRGEERGEFVTHVCPEDHPGGWPAFRSMAISNDGTLAYTSLEGNKVHFYELHD